MGADFKDLSVWQKAMDLTVTVYKIIRKLPNEERFALSDQLRRAAVSIPSNIAEGQSKDSTREFIRFLRIARGSAAEVETQLLLCNRLGYVEAEEIDIVCNDVKFISIMLYRLIDSLEESEIF